MTTQIMDEKMNVEIIKSIPSDAPLLTKIVKLSKKYWGYKDEQMKLWDSELTITPEEIEKEEVFHIKINNSIVGVYSLWEKESGKFEIGNFWIIPEFIGNGFGRLLFEHLLETARKKQAKIIRILSDPNAEKFYIKMGAIRVGEEESSISGRYLPVLEFKIV